MRFSLRDLVWLTLLISIGLGWWAHVQRLETRRRQLQADLVAQADLVDQFVSVVKDLDCEVEADTGGYAKIFVAQSLQSYFHAKGESAPVSFTLSSPEKALKRNLEGEFDRLRATAQ